MTSDMELKEKIQELGKINKELKRLHDSTGDPYLQKILLNNSIMNNILVECIHSVLDINEYFSDRVNEICDHREEFS